MEILEKIFSNPALRPHLSDPHVIKNFSSWLSDHSRHFDFAPEFQTVWKESNKSRAVRELLFLETLKTLDQAFSDEKIPALLAKGAALAYRYYENPLSRSYSDLDLYVQDCDWERAHQLLLKTGCVPDESSALWEGTSFRRVYFYGEIPIELHRNFLVRREIDEAFNSSRGLVVPGLKWLREPPAEILFVYLSGHGAFQHLFDEFQWLWDLHLMSLKEPGLNWDLIFKYADELSLKKALGLTLFLMRKNFSSPVPLRHSGLQIRLYAQYLTPFRMITRQTQTPRWLYLFLKAGMRDSLFEALTYGLRRLFKK